MTPLATIRSFVETTVATWAASQTPLLQVAYEGVPFVTPLTPFLQVMVVPSATHNNTIDIKRKTYYGFYQINVLAKDGKGRKIIEQVAQSIIDLFPVLPKGVVSVEQTPSANPSFTDGDGFRVLPIRIPYRYEASS